MLALSRRLALANPHGLEGPIAERLRAAQFAAATRHSMLMLAGNLFNASVVVAVAAEGAHLIPALAWAAALALFLSPAALTWKRAEPRAEPRTVSPRTLSKFIRNACVLGGLWGLAPMLFFHASEQSRLVVGLVAAGMLSGGGFALSAIPLAAIAYMLPIGLGYLVALAFASPPVHPLVAPITIAYVGTLIGLSISYARGLADVVIARARAEGSARHDPLTGLANASAFAAAVAESGRRFERYGEPFAALSIRFEEAPSLIGEGDAPDGQEWLRLVAARLRDVVDGRGRIARIGDDHFAVLTRVSADTRDARALAADIASRFDDAVALDHGLVVCRARVGVALAPEDGLDAQTLLASADAEICVSTAGPPPRRLAVVKGRIARRRELTRGMRRGLAQGEFFLVFQPIQNLRSGRVQGFEALARWRHPSLGLIPPLEFIEIAEKTGFIHDLGEWILNEALRQAAAWPEPARIAVNVSGEQLCDARFEALFARAIEHSGLDPRRVQIEVTESASLAAIDTATRALEALAARGAEVVLDDFGVGFSTLSQIGRLPVRRLKIDRAFVAGLPLERASAAVVEVVIGLGRALDLGITAEGVETEAQRAWLTLAGVDSAQGYLIAKPLEADEAAAWLTRQKAELAGLAA